MVLLKPLVTSPLIEVGEFSYYDDADDPTAFETKNVLYHYAPEKLIIGKFCALGEGVRFIMNGANHRVDGPSTFPFPIMGGSWADHMSRLADLPSRGDTVIGNDVWIGYRATLRCIGSHRLAPTGTSTAIVTMDSRVPVALRWLGIPASATDIAGVCKSIPCACRVALISLRATTPIKMTSVRLSPTGRSQSTSHVTTPLRYAFRGRGMAAAGVGRRGRRREGHRGPLVKQRVHRFADHRARMSDQDTCSMNR